MKTISTSQLRSRARSLVRALEKGTAVSLTYRGQKLANISPLKLKNGARADDPLYHFHRLADKSVKPLTAHPRMYGTRVWFTDAEADFQKGDYWYIRTLLDWSGISRGSFLPQFLSEFWAPPRSPDPGCPDWQDQPIEISYTLGGKQRSFELLERQGWLDTTLFAKVNESMGHTGYQFAVMNPNGEFDQCVYVCCFTMAEVQKLKDERGWKFADDCFCKTVGKPQLPTP